MTSFLAKIMKILEINDVLYQYLNSILYKPRITDFGIMQTHLTPHYVWNFVQTIVGFDRKSHIDYDKLPMMSQNDVGGTSSKNMMHWCQYIDSPDPSFFDYGYDENMRVYNQPTPPLYPVDHLSKTLAKTKMLLIAGERDAMINPTDFYRLTQTLP